MLLLLPDLSEWQPDADLAGIKAANGGAVILRAAYGADHPDQVFTRYRAEAAALGYSFTGLYQFLRADQDAVAQARAFCSVVRELAPHEVPVLDLEEGDGDQAARASQWFTLADGLLGLGARPVPERSWLYSYLDFAEEHGLASIFDGPRRTWVAAYGPDEPSLGHSLWQCTDGKTGPHVTNWPGCGNCDTSLYHGTLAQLAAISGRYEPPPPAAPRPWVTAGTDSLDALARAHGTTPAAILAATALHSPGQVLPADVARLVDGLFAGAAHPFAPMPGGLRLWLPG